MNNQTIERGIDMDVEIFSLTGKNSADLSQTSGEIAKQLDSILAYSIKEKAYACAVKLLAVKKNEIENKVDIVKNSNGFTVKCSVSGGDMDLMKLDVYAPEMEQALILKKNFLDNPKKAYKIMLALLTKDKETVGEALEELYGIV